MKTMLSILILAAVAGAQWLPASPMPEARYSGSAVAIGGVVYYIGGSVIGGVKSSSVFVYDADADQWTVGDSMHTARHRFGAAALDGKIYVFGGWGNSGVLLKSAECYDPALHTWTPIETLPGGRAAVFAAAANGRVYCIGGWNGTQTFDDVLEFNPQTGHWLEKAPMPTARNEGMVGTPGGLILCIGGAVGAATLLDTVESYDPAANQWSVKASMPTARMAAGSATEHNKTYVYGGLVVPAAATRVNEQYYLGSNSWGPDQPLPLPRRDVAGCFAMTVTSGPCIYAFGGQDSLMTVLSLVERLQVPMGIEEAGSFGMAPKPATFARPGTLLRGSLGPDAVASVVDAAGRVACRLRSGSPLPETRTGLYFVRWQDASGRSSVARLMVIAD